MPRLLLLLNLDFSQNSFPIPNWSKTPAVITAILAFLAGVGIANFGEFTSFEIILWLGLGSFLLLFRKSPLIFGLSLILLGISLGAWRFEANQHLKNAETLDYWNEQKNKVTLIGVIQAEPDQRLDHTKLTLEASAVWIGKNKVATRGRVLLKVPLLPAYSYGDLLRVHGYLETPFVSPEFNYQRYLALQEIYSIMYYPQIEKIGANQGNRLLAKIFQLKQQLLNLSKEIFLTEPHTNLLAGLLLGLRSGLPESVLKDFEITGLTHIVAISGYNISLIIIFITAIFGTLLPRQLQFPLALIVITIFTILVGASAGVVRAAIMGLLGFLALTLGRSYHIGLSLAFAALGMVLFNPKILLHDISFQLSFAAVLGLVYVSPILEKFCQKIPDTFAIRSSLLLTLSAQIAAVPLIVFYFERLSLTAPLANILVAPAIPLAMLTGFVAVLIGLVFLPAGIFIGFVTHLLLSWILGVAKFLAGVPLASLEIQTFGLVFAVTYYLGLIVFLIWWWKKQVEACKIKTESRNPAFFGEQLP